ncbi:MAG: ATP-binding protein [Planctomycetes bacterium]|nr:ATP-binding protein [Planctomycetota bacterium]
MTIFTVGADSLRPFSGQQAVLAFRDLLWAEAYRLGLSPASVTINQRIEIPDGGVDADVRAQIAPGRSLLVSGTTSFQIKGGASFEPWKLADLKKELFGKKKPSGTALGDEVRRCLEQSDRYVLVTFGHDLTPQRRRLAETHLRNQLAAAGFGAANVEVWGIGQLLGAARPFPSLCLEFNGRDWLDLQSFDSWANTMSLRSAFVPGPPQQALLAELQAAFRGGTRHVRLTGEPGLGKTRIVLESLRSPDLAPLVLYCAHAERFLQSSVFKQILRPDNRFHAIIVVDDCSTADLSNIWDAIQPRSDRIRLVTVGHDHDLTTDTQTVRRSMPLLPREQIIEILRGHEVLAGAAYHWADICEGSPRVAHVIGGNLKHNPGDVLAPPTNSNIWERFVVGADDPASPRVRQRWLVLRYVALFLRFGMEGQLAGEGRAIAELIQAADPTITFDVFCSVVRDMRRRRVLQGASTLRLVPRALHVWLWTQWWEHHGPTFDAPRFLGLPGRLPAWFCELFRYAGSSPAAASRARALLDDPTVLNDAALQEHAGAAMFNALAEACPEAAVRFLERTLGRWGDEILRAFGPGRRSVIFALEKIAMGRSSFPRAALVLARLAECENERCGNNASGVFAGLFSLGNGSGAPTEAPPAERLSTLRAVLLSDRVARRQLGLQACRSALYRGPFTRIGGAEFRGLHQATPWVPRDQEELLQAYRSVWTLTLEAWRLFDGEDKLTAGTILIESGPRLLSNALDELIVETFEELAAVEQHRRALLDMTLNALDTDHNERRGACYAAPIRARLQALHDRLVGTSLVDRVHRHVGLNLRADRPRSRTYSESEEIIRDRLRQLATECVRDEPTLRQLLPWLLSRSAERAMLFAVEIARVPVAEGFVDIVVEAQDTTPAESASLCFLAGLLLVERERGAENWHRRLDELAAHRTRATWVPELTWRSSGVGGLDERAARRVHRVIEAGAAPPTTLAFWHIGRDFMALPWEVAELWIIQLLAVATPQTTSIATALFADYFCPSTEPRGPERQLPRELTRRVLHQGFPARGSEDASREYDWTRIAEAYRQQYPADALDLMVLVLERLREDRQRISASDEAASVLHAIFAADPRAAWERLAPLMEDWTNAWFVLHWLQDSAHVFGDRGPGLLHLVPCDLLWAWVDVEPQRRAPLLARNVHNSLEGAAGALTRDVLVRYGGIEHVMGELHANFSTEGWCGSEAGHYRRCLQNVVRWSEGESDPHVRRWLEDRIDYLNRRINNAIDEEEREDY